MSLCVPLCVCICVYVCTRMHVCAYVYVCVCVCMYGYMIVVQVGFWAPTPSSTRHAQSSCGVLVLFLGDLPALTLECLISAQASQLAWVGMTMLHGSYRLCFFVCVHARLRFSLGFWMPIVHEMYAAVLQGASPTPKRICPALATTLEYLLATQVYIHLPVSLTINVS